MIRLILLISLFLMYSSCSKKNNDDNQVVCEGDFSTANVLTEIDEEIYNDDESVNEYSKYSWTSDGSDRILSGNGIPNHEVGTFPNSNNLKLGCCLFWLCATDCKPPNNKV